MKEINLTQGQVAIVDDDDLEWLSEFKWHAIKAIMADGRIRTFYARRDRLAPVAPGFMHRFILGLSPDDPEVDHKDGNGLNNQRSNIRIATHAQNMWNQHHSPINKLGLKGVTRKKHGRFQANIRANGRGYYLGTYNTAEEAAAVYDHWAKKLHDEFARPNGVISQKTLNEILATREIHQMSEDGVHWVKSVQKWETKPQINGHRVFLGQFVNRSDAVAAREAYLADQIC